MCSSVGNRNYMLQFRRSIVACTALRLQCFSATDMAYPLGILEHFNRVYIVSNASAPDSCPSPRLGGAPDFLISLGLPVSFLCLLPAFSLALCGTHSRMRPAPYMNLPTVCTLSDSTANVL